MAQQELVSVGIMSYNRLEELGVAIDSVLAQSYENLEIIISDNASTKAGVVDLIRDYAARDSRIRAIFHEQNRGMHFNLKFVSEEARGMYFCWLASDDAYGGDFIHAGIDQLNAHPEAVMASCAPYYLHSGDKVAMKHLPHTIGLPIVQKYERVIAHLYEDPNLFYYSLYRTDALRRAHLHYKKLFAGDTLLLLEMLSYGDLMVDTRHPGLLYRMHEGQVSASPTQYRSMLMPWATTFTERRGFFTAHVYYMLRIVWERHELRFPDKLRISRKIMNGFVGAKRHHLLKYDLGFVGTMRVLKRLAGRK